MIHATEIVNRNLHPMQQAQLLMALNMVEQGASITVCLTAPKVTDTPPRIGDGKDYVSLPGISPETQIGTLSVHRYVDNRENQKLERVGAVYFKVKSITRANGLRPYGFANLRPSQLTGFMVLGIETHEEQEQLATAALAEAAQAQAPTVGA